MAISYIGNIPNAHIRDHQRKRLYEAQKNQIEQDMAPFGIMVDGMEDDSFIEDGERLYSNASEYGDSSYMWEYLS